MAAIQNASSDTLIGKMPNQTLQQTATTACIHIFHDQNHFTSGDARARSP